MSDGPLSGRTVLEIDDRVASSYAGRVLAACGARVIRIEHPHRGAPTRRLGPFLDAGDEYEGGAVFHFLNGNKESITLDWTDAYGSELLGALARHAAAAVDARPPEERAPALPDSCATVAIDNFARGDPFRSWLADDMMVQLVAIDSGQTGYVGREPIRGAPDDAEYIAGAAAAYAVIAAILMTARGDPGARAEVALRDASMLMPTRHLTQARFTQRFQPRPEGPRPMSILPCLDGFANIQTGLPWGRIVDMIGDESLRGDPRFQTLPDRLAHAEELNALLIGWAATVTREELGDRAERARVTGGALLEAGELVTNRHYAERGAFVPVDDERYPGLRLPFAPFRISTLAWRSPGLGPRAGEHTTQVLSELCGLEAATVARLHQAGVA